MNQHLSFVPLLSVIATLEACPTAALMIDSTACVTHLNPAFRCLFAAKTGIAEGSDLRQSIVPEDLVRFKAQLRSSRCGERPAPATCRLIGVDSTVTLTALDTGNGGISCLLGYVERPIENDLLTIHQLQEQERRWQTALQCAQQAVWDTWNPLGDHYVSDHWYEMRGINSNRKKIDTETWQARVHPDDLALVEAYHARQNAGELDHVNYQYRYRHADGHWIWILSRGRVLSRDESGFPTRVVGTDMDITSFKEIETNLIDMASRLQMAIEASEIGIWELGAQPGTTKWDARMRKMYGITDGRDFRPDDEWPRLLHPDDRDTVLSHAQDCLENGTDFAMDYRIAGADGEVRHIRSLAKNRKAEQTGDVGLLGVNINITQDVRKSHELEAVRASLEYDSRHDALTGLVNRRGLDEYHARIVADANGQPPQLTLLHLDLDRFKEINDRFGHAAGDAVLVHVGKELRKVVGPEDQASRQGGDEFVIVLRSCAGPDAANALALVILNRLRQPFVHQGNICNFGVSIGIAQCSDQDGGPFDVFVNADLALYAAKRAGRNCVRIYEPAMRVAAASRRTTSDVIGEALANGEIMCHYQPQFTAKNRRLVGFEALARWNSPEHGLLMPAQFLPRSKSQDCRRIWTRRSSGPH
jgi:diguanylate cyclase (GGDEF)-like protein/PAS domain S-box-containing protein